MYLQDFVLDFERLEEEIARLPFRSVKGTTGTQASFLALFDGDHERVKKLEKRVAEKMGFDNVIAVSGQTYTRKLDFYVLSVLSGIAQSAYKMAGDIRIARQFTRNRGAVRQKQIVPAPWPTRQSDGSERVCSSAAM